MTAAATHSDQAPASPPIDGDGTLRAPGLDSTALTAATMYRSTVAGSSGRRAFATTAPNDSGPSGRPDLSGERAWGSSARRSRRMVANDFGDHLAVALDELRRADAAGAQTALGERLLAEPVNRRDRRLVEAGEAPAQPGAPALAHPRRSGVEHPQPLLAGWDLGAVEVVGGQLHLAADAISQLGCGGARVRDDEHLVDADPLGEVVVVAELAGDEAGDEHGDREGLAGAGTGLDQRAPGRQGRGELERRRAHLLPARSPTGSTAANASTAPQIEFAKSRGDGDIAVSSLTLRSPQTNWLAASERSPVW